MKNMRIAFTVQGPPPMKRGEKSMWARKDQAPRVAVLRKEALAARKLAGFDSPFSGAVRLEIQVFVPEAKFRSIGDLDNLITGVCDALQPAAAKVLPYLHPVFLEDHNEQIHPTRSILFEDDSQVVSIVANKVITEGPEVYYSVEVNSHNTEEEYSWEP